MVIFILLVIIAILFVFSCVIIYSASTRYFNSAELTMRARNSKSVDTFFTTYNNGDPDSFTLGAYKFVENFLYRDIMEVWVIDKNGRMIVSSFVATLVIGIEVPLERERGSITIR